MTQPIAGFRPTDAWAGAGLDDPPPLDPPPTGIPGTAPQHPSFEPPNSASSPRTATTWVATQAVLAPRREAGDAIVQQRLDAFRGSLTAPYHTPEGDQEASVPFRMSRPYPEQAQALATNRPALLAAARSARLEPALGRIESGRGTPNEIHALTQALIDRGRLPPAAGTPPPSIQLRIRRMMFDHGIGLDCAGYVQQAHLRATGLSRSEVRLGRVENEDLSNLGQRGFTRIADPSNARPGDIFVLGPPPSGPDDPHPVGHRAIVYDQHPATAADIRDLLAGEDAAQSFSVGGPIDVFAVDSSWGCGGNADVGGAKRETWWYNETSRRWGWRDQDGDFQTDSVPYGHPVAPPNGIFRGPTGRLRP